MTTHTRLLILGAGGHAKVIADAAITSGHSTFGFLDDQYPDCPPQVIRLPVLGRVSEWLQLNPDGLVIGIGDNRIRRLVTERVEAVSSSPPWMAVQHSSAVVSTTASIGHGTVVLASTVIGVDTTIGRHVIINTGATVDHDCVIGDYVHVAPGAHLAGNVQVGVGVLIGIGAAVIPGCRVGENAIIGAGAVVVGDVPSGATVVGVPAKIIKVG